MFAYLHRQSFSIAGRSFRPHLQIFSQASQVKGHLVSMAMPSVSRESSSLLDIFKRPTPWVQARAAPNLNVTQPTCSTVQLTEYSVIDFWASSGGMSWAVTHFWYFAQVCVHSWVAAHRKRCEGCTSFWIILRAYTKKSSFIMMHCVTINWLRFQQIVFLVCFKEGQTGEGLGGEWGGILR